MAADATVEALKRFLEQQMAEAAIEVDQLILIGSQNMTEDEAHLARYLCGRYSLAWEAMALIKERE